MPNDIFVISNGDAIITPTINPKETTVSLILDDDYHKFRHIRVDLASKIKNCAGILFNPDAWYQVGLGKEALLFNKNQVDNAINSIQDFQKKISVLNTFNSWRNRPISIQSVLDMTSERVFSGIREIAMDDEISLETRADREQIIDDLLNDHYKITCLMNSRYQLQVVAKQTLVKSKEKIIQYMLSIWEKGTCPYGPEAVLAKGQKGRDAKWLVYEEHISEKLRRARIPYILRMCALTRCNPRKTTLMMEYCNCGNLKEFVSQDFDIHSHTLLPKYRPLHIALLRQVVEALHGMQTQNLIHRDLKAENVLVQWIRGKYEIRLIDFPCTTQVGSQIQYSAGTYPPPEIQQAVDKNQKEAVSHLSEPEKKKYHALVKKWQKQGLDQCKIKEKQYAYLEKYLPMIPLSTHVDEWALGVLICQTMRYLPELIQKMTWTNPSSELLSARKTLLSHLDSVHDSVDKIAVNLLAQQLQRVSIKDTRDAFKIAT